MLAKQKQAEKYMDWISLTNSELKFSLAHPADWQTEYPGKEIILYPEKFKAVSVPGAMLRSPAITIQVATLSAQRKASEVYQQYLGNQPNFFQKYKLLWKEPLTLVSGEEAHIWSYEFDRDGKRFRAICCQVLKGRELYILEGSGITSHIKKQGETIKKILESLTLTQ